MRVNTLKINLLHQSCETINQFWAYIVFGFDRLVMFIYAKITMQHIECGVSKTLLQITKLFEYEQQNMKNNLPLS